MPDFLRKQSCRSIFHGTLVRRLAIDQVKILPIFYLDNIFFQVLVM